MEGICTDTTLTHGCPLATLPDHLPKLLLTHRTAHLSPRVCPTALVPSCLSHCSTNLDIPEGSAVNISADATSPLLGGESDAASGESGSGDAGAGGGTGGTGGPGRRLGGGAVAVSSPAGGAVMDGRGRSRLFDVRGTLRIQGLALMNGRAQHGGCIRVRAGATIELIDVTMSGCRAEAGGELYGGAFGGGIQNAAGSTTRMTRVTISGCTATHSGSGDALGGAMYVQGDTKFSGVTMEGCSATSADTARGQGGGLFVVSGSVLLMDRTVLRSNSASGSGHTFLAVGGTATYRLPAPPGRWIAGVACLVYRATCERDIKGNVMYPECVSTYSECSQLVQASAIVSVTTSSGSTVPWQCRPLLNNQPCEWATEPSLVGSTVQVLPPMPLDSDYPTNCAPGILGSNLSSSQTGAMCAGPCPMQYYCPIPATVKPVLCPKGHACPEGSSVAVPCPTGTWTNQAGLSSTAQCFECPAGSSCVSGSTIPDACGQGRYTNASGYGKCDVCKAGQYQDEMGQTECKEVRER